MHPPGACWPALILGRISSWLRHLREEAAKHRQLCRLLRVPVEGGWQMGLLIFMPPFHTLCTSRVHEACTWQAWPSTGTRSRRAGSEPPGREDDRGSLEAGRTQGIDKLKCEQMSRRKMDGKSEMEAGRRQEGCGFSWIPAQCSQKIPTPGWRPFLPCPHGSLFLPLSPLLSRLCLFFTAIDFHDELQSNAAFQRFYFYLHIWSH